MSVRLARRLTSYIFPTSNIYTRLRTIPVVRELAMTTLETLNFDNRVLRSLPLDREEKNYVRTVQGACYSRVDPTPVKNPTLVAHSPMALSLLDITPAEVARPEFLGYFSGSKTVPGSEPASHCYCGHQFGYFSGQLGDGCAHYLGEIVNSRGERWEVQLKGSGKTPYSRQADGRKVLRSSIREFLCSEAMYHLGIPTTRAGTCITSDDYVTRDIFYNGNIIKERVTIITRIAPTFLRFGSFEIFKVRDIVTGRVGPSVGRMDILHQLLDHTTRSFFPEIYAAHSEDRAARTAAMFTEVCVRTGRLVALWQCVGFCHGVLNTDNMSIIGVTIDYGPFGFLDRFNPAHICNGSDDGGRYAYDRQPSICHWNLQKLAEALAPCLPPEKAKEGLSLYEAEFQKTYLDKMRCKLGLVQKQLPEDSDIAESFLDTMHKTGCDFTNGFLCLAEMKIASSKDSDVERVSHLLVEQCATPQELVKGSKPSISAHQLQIFSQLMQQSPELLSQLGITPETLRSEMSKLENMEKMKSTPPEKKMQEDREAWLAWLKTYRSRLLQEVEGLETEEIERGDQVRRETMQQNNPRFVLRNHIAQKAIEMAEKGDYSEVNRVLRLLESPYSPPGDTAGADEKTESACAPTPDSYESASMSVYFSYLVNYLRNVRKVWHCSHTLNKLHVWSNNDGLTGNLFQSSHP